MRCHNTWNKSSQKSLLLSLSILHLVGRLWTVTVFLDCPGYFRLYYYTIGNDTGTIEFPVANMTDPNNPDGGGMGGGSASSSSGVPGFGLMAGVSALAMAAVAVSRKSEE